MNSEASKQIIARFGKLRILAIVLTVVMPIMVFVLTDRQTILFGVVIPMLPFVILAILSAPPKVLHVDRPYKKAGALLFANIGAVLILLSYSLFYLYRTMNYSGGGADIGMGIVMLTMPITLLIGVSISALLGEYAGSRFSAN